MLGQQQDNARVRMAFTQIIDQIVITPDRKPGSNGLINIGHRHFQCKIGRSGIGQKQREGDGITPVGQWKMAYFLYRPDKLTKPRSFLQGFPFNTNDSWCDIPNSRTYNQPLGFVPPNSSESLWRNDDLYNIVIILDHNSCPFIANQGSAVFIHTCSPDTKYTQGCIALNQANMLQLLTISGARTKVLIKP